jgi:hypothetical protein
VCHQVPAESILMVVVLEQLAVAVVALVVLVVLQMV